MTWKDIIERLESGECTWEYARGKASSFYSCAVGERIEKEQVSFYYALHQAPYSTELFATGLRFFACICMQNLKGVREEYAKIQEIKL